MNTNTQLTYANELGTLYFNYIYKWPILVSNEDELTLIHLKDEENLHSGFVLGYFALPM